MLFFNFSDDTLKLELQKKYTWCIIWCQRLRGGYCLRLEELCITMLRVLLWLQHVIFVWFLHCRESLRICRKSQFLAISWNGDHWGSAKTWALRLGLHPWRKSLWRQLLMLKGLKRNHLMNLLTFGMMYVTLDQTANRSWPTIASVSVCMYTSFRKHDISCKICIMSKSTCCILLHTHSHADVLNKSSVMNCQSVVLVDYQLKSLLL